MDLKAYEHFADSCFRDTPAPCSAVCPFGLDTREFVKHMQRGNYRGAYRTYQKAVLFPRTAANLCSAPCSRACVRSLHDRSVDLNMLEKICIEKSGKNQPTRYSRIKKDQTAAVIGGGLAGLAFAHRMSSWGYPVTVYEKENTIGGSALMKMDPQICLEELNREFSVLDCKFVTGQEIISLSSLQEDVIFVATGSGGNDFSGETRPGIYRGGQLIGATGVESIVHGLQAARAVDNALRSGRFEDFSPSPAPTKVDSPFYGLPYEYEARSHIPGKGEEEAGRCMLCNCHQCYDVCPMMQQQNLYPKRMCLEVVITIKPNMSRRTGVRMINDCTYCGACEQACPVGVDMGSCLEHARKDYYDSGAMPPAFHDYWLQDLDFSLSDEAQLLIRTNPDAASDILFFPGCQLGASDPQYVIGAYELLKTTVQNPSLFLSCCGLPARWAGEEAKQRDICRQFRKIWEDLGKPTVITACTSCMSNLLREIPELPVMSLYTWLARHPHTLPTGDKLGTVQILDPCASSRDPETQQSIRTILTHCGYTPDSEAANVGCCGFGGHMYAVDPELFGVFADRRTQDISGSAVTYCANCRDIFASRGTACQHILDIVLKLGGSNRKPPELEQRRANRRNLKHHYSGEPNTMNKCIFPLTIPEPILEKMNAQMLLRSQAEEVVALAEQNQRKLLDEETGLYYCHGQFGAITIWAAYRLTEAGAVLENIYSHRVSVKED